MPHADYEIPVHVCAMHAARAGTRVKIIFSSPQSPFRRDLRTQT